MSDHKTAAEQPLPRAVTLFAPWRMWTKMRLWKRWALALVLLIVGYIEAPIFIVPVLNLTSVSLPVAVDSFFRISLSPLEASYNHFPMVKAFYDFQFEAIRAVLRWIGFD